MSGILNFLILTIILSTVRSETKPHACFKHFKVVPDVLAACPLSWADVTFSGKKVCGGNVLTPTETMVEPKVKYDGEPGQFYTVAMVDPDVPTPKNFTHRSFKNWLVVNVPGKKIKAGDALAEYYSPAPLEGAGLYRYVIIVYKQPKKIDFKEPKVNSTSHENRSKFDINKFAKKYKLGVPIAGNFFRAEWDESVPELHKKRGVVCDKDHCERIKEEGKEEEEKEGE